MALNEEKILSGKFVFISYSHKDEEAVKEDVGALLARGVRAWFDVNMRVGEKWTDIAMRILHHENCAGVIFYNSANSFVSEAVQKEQEITRALGHKYWAVHLDSKPTTAISVEAMNLVTSKYGLADQITAKHMTQIMPEQIKMFDEKILCFMRESSSELVDRIYNEVAIPYRLVDNEDNFLSDLKRSEASSSDVMEIKLGRYVSGEYVGPEKPTGEVDQRFGASNDLMQINGKCYTTKELSWRLMYVEDGKAVLICNKILKQATYNDGKAFLENVFCHLAFSSSDIETYGEIKARYMTEMDVEKNTNPNALELSFIGKLKHWWIDADGLTINWKQTYSDNICYKNGFSCLIKKGVRPVIEMPAQQLK